MVPPLQILDDLGKDYGIYAGGAGRTGYITPQAPYPDATSPPTVTNVSPASGVAAGGTAITITGSGFTGATGVTVGGTAATAVVVVNSYTITAPRRRMPPAPSISASPRRKASARSPPPPITSSTYRLAMSSGFRPNDQMHLPGLGVPDRSLDRRTAAATVDRAAAAAQGSRTASFAWSSTNSTAPPRARGPATAAWRWLSPVWKKP